MIGIHYGADGGLCHGFDKNSRIGVDNGFGFWLKILKRFDGGLKLHAVAVGAAFAAVALMDDFIFADDDECPGAPFGFVGPVGVDLESGTALDQR